MIPAIIYSTILILGTIAVGYQVYKLYADQKKARKRLEEARKDMARIEAETAAIMEANRIRRQAAYVRDQMRADGKLANPFAEPAKVVVDSDDEVGYDPFDGMRAIEASDSEDDEEDQR